MYSLGSVVAVGSWFFISVTSSSRKSFAVIAAVDVEELEESSPDEEDESLALARLTRVDPGAAETAAGVVA